VRVVLDVDGDVAVVRELQRILHEVFDRGGRQRRVDLDDEVGSETRLEAQAFCLGDELCGGPRGGSAATVRPGRRLVQERVA
jgi:hypothetical protein